MSFKNILLDDNNQAISPRDISEKVKRFEYGETSRAIIEESEYLDNAGEIFIKCSARVLSNFGMTRRGPFFGVSINQKGEVTDNGILKDCWMTIGGNLIQIKNLIIDSRIPRNRYLLLTSESQREKIIAEIWSINKQLLRFSMGTTTYGLVGASKILFSVLPEIVLPVDNSQWLNVFKTVDLGDVIRDMVLEIQRWEAATGKKLNEMDPTNRLTTLPSIYNVMAMDARPNNAELARPEI